MQTSRLRATDCAGEQLIWRASSVQQRNTVPVTSSNHVGRMNDAIIARLNYIHKFIRCINSTTTTSEVGLLLMLAL